LAKLFIGLLSGTSMDGIDAGLVDFSGDQLQLVDYFSTPYPTQVSDALQRLTDPENPTFLKQYGELDTQLGQLFADAALSLLKQSSRSADDIMAIGSHGQTVYHAPDAPFPFCLQIGDPNVIAEKTGITTIADFRRRDIAAGGQGAPLVPAFHQLFFSDPTETRIILNIGGIANITVLPENQNKSIFGFDTGPGNALMDDWVRKHLSVDYDENGDWANSGSCQVELLNELLQDAYFKIDPPKSTGKEYFSLSWLEKKLGKQKKYLPEDIQASLCHFTASTITQAIKKHVTNPDRVLVCGGGVHNRLLMDLLQQQLSCPVNSTDEYGLNPDQVEAVAFAWLAKQTVQGLPGNLTTVTGAKNPVILGAIYPSLHNNQH
jgi:anhydro-N-acetylmuramic acid kinase